MIRCDGAWRRGREFGVWGVGGVPRGLVGWRNERIRGFTHSVIGGAIGLGVEALHPLPPARLPHDAIDVHLMSGFGHLVAAGLLVLLAAFVAGLPDLDLRLGLRHRRVTHSLVAAATVTLFVGSVAGALMTTPAALELALATGAAYLSHLAADSVNPMPVAILWPLRPYRPAWLPSVREDSLAGRAVEWVVLIGVAGLVAWQVRG